MKVEIYCDELYPYFGTVKSATAIRNNCDVPDDVLERWNKVNAEFDAVQKEMESYYNKANDKTTV